MNSINIDINSVRGKTCGLFNSTGHGGHPPRIRPDWEIILVKSGTLYMFLDDIRYEIKAGQALVIKAGQLHGGYRDYDSDLSFYWLHFFADMSQSDLVSVMPLSASPRPDRLVELFENYLTDIYAKRQGSIAKDYIARLILLEISEFSDKKTGYFNPLAIKIHSFIHENISKPLTSSFIARELNFSTDYIERVYKKAYGETITVGIQKARIFHASELLRYTTLSIAEIADMSGFVRANDFSRIFRRVKAVTPTEYRKQYCQIL